MYSTLSAYDQWLARREDHRRLCAAGGEDRLSALPDDVLRLILRRLDTRSALATAALSKHWARLPRDLPVLEFKVGDVLPERYHGYLRRRRLDAVDRGKLDIVIGRYERQAMRSLGNAVRSFLGAGDGDYARRSAQAMTLELFPTHNSSPFNRLIATAVGDWGVQDLEVVVLNSTPCRRDASYTFPHRCFDDSKSPGGLKRLKLSNCAPLPARNDGGGGPPPAFSSLTVLVLQGIMPKSTSLYQRVLQGCPMLEVLHLKSCLFRGKISIDAPASRIKELMLDACTFRVVTLWNLPMLERLACRGAHLTLRFGSLPLLTSLNLSFYDDPNAGPDPRHAAYYSQRDEYSFLDFSSRFPVLESLVVGFTGPEMWVVPDLAVPLGNLRRLLVADMPRSWDASWTCRILEAAPSLETLHVHVASRDCEETAFGPAIPEPPSGFTHQALREVVIVGFKANSVHIHFVRFLVSACTALEKVAMLKHGRVVDKGLWDWEMAATQEDCPWNNEEKDVISRQILAVSSTTRIVLG
ncbi:hypothetical protein ACP70R_013549 [Stipagrostis hirtigluma subsp. patula]